MGKAIVVDGVNWAANSVEKVTLLGGGGGGETPPTNIQEMYNAYLVKSGRSSAASLKSLLTELDDASLLTKCTGLFYLASGENNAERIKYSVTDLRALSVGSGTPIISSTGVKANGGRGFNDPGGYNINARGMAVVFMISETPTGRGFDWGGDLGVSGQATYISSGGGYGAVNGTVMWAGGVVIPNADDEQSRKGVFLWYTKGNVGRYKHGIIDKTVTVATHKSTNANPQLLNWDGTGLNSPSTATMKMYATFNNDLSESEVKNIHDIFAKYVDLL